MECGEVKQFISKNLKRGQLLTIGPEVNKHLEACNVCSEFLKEEKKLDKLLYLKTFEHPKEEYWTTCWERVSQKLSYITKPIKEYREKLNFFRNILFPGFGIIGATAAIILAFYVGRQSTEISSLRAELQKRESVAMIGPDRYILPVSIDTARKGYKVFSETRTLFPDALKWVVMDGDDIKFEIDNRVQYKTVSSKQEPLLFEFRLFSMKDRQRPVLISNPQVILYSKSDVTFKVQTMEEIYSKACIYECLPDLRDNGVSELKLKFSMDGTTLNIAMVLDEERTLEVGRFRSGNEQYLLTVSMLKNKLKTLEDKQQDAAL